VPSVSANQQFSQANAAYTSGAYPLAKQQYIKAKELDMLRFRAPDAMNQAIIKLTEKYQNVHLVDARKCFEEHSPHQIIGNETLLEHVHPNLYGYAVLSDAFYQSIQKAHLIKSHKDKEISFTDLLSQMPVTQVDSLYGAYTIMMLKTGWPFNIPISAGFKRGNSINEQLAGALSVNRISWMDAMNQLFQYSIKLNDKKTALKAVEAVMLESPRNITYKIYAGKLSFDLGNYTDASFYLKMAYEQEPSFANTQDMYLVYLKTDQPDKSVSYIKSAMQLHPQDLTLQGLLSTVQKIIQLKTELALLPNNKTLKDQIAFNYHTIAFDEVADRYK
jgi:tetratricopeptide (TPR) repeat protein